MHMQAESNTGKDSNRKLVVSNVSQMLKKNVNVR